MRHKLFFSLFVASVLTIQVHAQLQVLSNGNAKFTKNVGIGTDPANKINLNLYQYVKGTALESYGLKSHLKADSIMPIGNVIAVDGHADLSTFHLDYYSSSMRRAIGVLGEITMNANCVSRVFGVAVAGVVNYRGTNGGVAIYGSTNQAYLFPTGPSGLYAGLFGGNVKIAGTATANAFVTSSDSRIKRDVETIGSGTSSTINSLRPVSYFFKPDSTRFAYQADDFEMHTVHYGLIAQEVKQVYPNLVYEDEAGFLSINYIELIPLLIKNAQELSSKVQILESEIDELRIQQGTSEVSARRLASNSPSPILAKLYQNTPNPFNQSTEIRYDLPLETSQAFIYIYDMSGLQIAAYNITKLGIGSITIHAGNLQAGMYLYSLIADGQIIDTKQMILTK